MTTGSPYLFDLIVAQLQRRPGWWHMSQVLADVVYGDLDRKPPLCPAKSIVRAINAQSARFHDMGGESGLRGFRVGQHADALVQACRSEADQMLILRLRAGPATQEQLANQSSLEHASLNGCLARLRRVVRSHGYLIAQDSTAEKPWPFHLVEIKK